eukprot:tig00000396_g24907.t2
MARGAVTLFDKFSIVASPVVASCRPYPDVDPGLAGGGIAASERPSLQRALPRREPSRSGAGRGAAGSAGSARPAGSAGRVAPGRSARQAGTGRRRLGASPRAYPRRFFPCASSEDTPPASRELKTPQPIAADEPRS